MEQSIASLHSAVCVALSSWLLFSVFIMVDVGGFPSLPSGHFPSLKTSNFPLGAPSFLPHGVMMGLSVKVAFSQQTKEWAGALGPINCLFGDLTLKD